MLINCWVLVDDIGQVRSGHQRICLHLHPDNDNIAAVISAMQHPTAGRFSIMIPQDPLPAETIERFTDLLMTLFFQPRYSFSNYMPVVFIRAHEPRPPLLELLTAKARGQGFAGLSVRTVYAAEGEIPHGIFALELQREFPRLDPLITNWTNSFLSNQEPPEINLLIRKDDKSPGDIAEGFDSQLSLLQNTDSYKAAFALYEQRSALMKCSEELKRMTDKERDHEYYLAVQMEERSKGMEWYHREYEVLPLWYKRFGHIIKVITGKRTFRSLFRDDDKKYKD
ncbi:MAG TPA: hypothetical protein VGC95_10365 [Chitinophagaceae bacterium]|jgi:hypothetical protein